RYTICTISRKACQYSTSASPIRSAFSFLKLRSIPPNLSIAGANRTLSCSQTGPKLRTAQSEFSPESHGGNSETSPPLPECNPSQRSDRKVIQSSTTSNGISPLPDCSNRNARIMCSAPTCTIPLVNVLL